MSYTVSRRLITGLLPADNVVISEVSPGRVKGTRSYPVSGATPFNVKLHEGGRFYLGSGSSKTGYQLVFNK